MFLRMRVDILGKSWTLLEGGCKTFTNTLSEGELAIIDRSGKILSPSVPLAQGDFMFALGGVNGWNSTSLLIYKKTSRR